MPGTSPSCNASGAFQYIFGLFARVRSAKLAGFACFGALLTAGLFPYQSEAADLTWGGNYRVEGFGLKNPELGTDQTTQGGQSQTGYALHHLTLLPKLVAGDGLTIYSRLDILNNQNSKAGIDSSGRVYSVAGDLLGSGPGTAPAAGTGNSTSTTSSDSNALSNTEMAGTVAITELYAAWSQEFGQLLVGRMPMDFGLGVAFSSGSGLFDHYVDTKDAIAYKLIFGNISVMPIVGKVKSGAVGQQDDIWDYMAIAKYENPESELKLGGFYQLRSGTFGANDYPLNSSIGGGDIGTNGTLLNGATPPASSVTRADGFKTTLIGAFVSEKVGDLRVSVEANLFSGDSGLKDAQLNGVSINAYGIAAEVNYANPDSKLNSVLKLGMASGDDPGTTNVYEGYQFNRNYDVALLLFNHPLGQQDFLRSGMVHDNSIPVRNQLDTEAISNAMYIAPGFQYHVKDSFSWGGTFVYAMLNKDPVLTGTAPNQKSAGTSMDLGEELDLNMTWKPMERLTWITTIGGLLPGQAWLAGGLPGYTNSFAYGIETKAAISF